MKSRLCIVCFSISIGFMLASFAVADTPSDILAGEVSIPTTQQPQANFKQIREKKMAERAALLGLTDAQQSQIKAIVSAARQANEPLRQKLASDRKQIKTLSSAVPFDEAAIRALIASGEAARTELAISRIKVRNQIQALLTPDQQTKAKQLRLSSPSKHHKSDHSVGF